MKLEILKDKNFVLLMFGKLVSLVGSGMQTFSLSLYVLAITGSATKFASVLIVASIPRLVLCTFSGVFVDWLDRKRIIVYLDLANGILIGIFAIIFSINGRLTLNHIYLLAILMAIIESIFNPAINTIIPSIVEKKDLMNANSVNSIIMNIGGLFSPVLAGILFGIYGLFPILIINSISFILSAISEMFIKVPKNNNKPEKISIKTFSDDFKGGIKFVLNEKTLLSILIVALTANFAFAPMMSIGFTYLCKEVIKTTDFQYGIYEAIITLGMIIGPIICGSVTKKMGLGRSIFYSLLIDGILICSISIIISQRYFSLFSSNLIPYISMIIWSFAIMLTLTIANICIGTLQYQRVPLEYMGRFNTIAIVLSGGMVPLGQALFGYLLDNINPGICVMLSGTLIILVVIVLRRGFYYICEEKILNENGLEIDKALE